MPKPKKTLKSEIKRNLKRKKKKTLLPPVDTSLLPVKDVAPAAREGSIVSSPEDFNAPIMGESAPVEPEYCESKDLKVPKISWWDNVKKWFSDAYRDLF